MWLEGLSGIKVYSSKRSHCRLPSQNAGHFKLSLYELNMLFDQNLRASSVQCFSNIIMIIIKVDTNVLPLDYCGHVRT